jgi:uncharacterized repeat protein (TIGR01451 family)
MGSNIDLNSEFLTSRPIAYFEPVDPAILTQPAWVNGNVFLTPGAGNSIVKNSTPLPTSNASTGVPTIIGTTAVPTNPGVVTNTVVPTNTLVWIPIPATRTSKPGPAATNTSPPSAPDADLWIIKDSTTGTYTAGSTLTYRVRVGNNGPDTINGVTVRDNKPDQITSWTWTCTNPGVNGCDGAALNSGNFSDSVNLSSGATIEYTVNVTTNSFGGNLTNTARIIATGYTETSPGNEQDGHTHTLTVVPLEANLQITKTDNAAYYAAGGSTIYSIEVRNTGPSPVTGVRVQDTLPGQIALASTTWTCGSTNGGSCTAGGLGNIDDSAVNLPVGSSVVYRIVAPISVGVSGDLVNQAYASLPVGYAGLSPVQATDTDTQIIADPAPPSEIGESRDCPNHPAGLDCTYELGWDGMGGTLTWTFLTPVMPSGNGNPDLVYYERPSTGSGILMDWVIIEISDGHNWYTVLNWGNGSPDNNTNISGFSPEIDNQAIPYSALHNGTGITIDIDSIVGTAPGPFLYIRITAPADGDDGVAIDGVGPYP